MRGALACVVVGAALLGPVTGTAALAATPSPSPYDSATTLSVSPRALTSRAALSLSGFSDCAVIDGHLLFTRYDGSADNVVVRGKQATRYDAAREKFPFAVRITVPPGAKPGTARVYAEPFCGPPEEYPSSRQVTVRITRSPLGLTATPRRPVGGSELRVRASTCNGPGDLLTLRVALAGTTQSARARVGPDGVAEARFALPATAGTATLSAPAAARECPGSTAASALQVRVRAPRSAASSAATAVAPSASPSATRERPAPETATPARTATATADATPSRGRGPGGGSVLAGVGVLVAAGTGLLLLRRRSRARPRAWSP